MVARTPRVDMPPRISPFQPLRHPSFRMLWMASLVSNLGTLVQGVGAGWMMTSLSSSDDFVALVQASTTLPVMVLALAAGAIADSFDRRKVMLVAQMFMAVISAALALAAWQGLLGPWTLLMFTFLIGCGQALHLPAWQSSVRDMVPREELAAAVSMNAMGFNAMRSVGPAIGGLIVAAAGPAAAFALNALSYLAVLTALFLWTPQREDRNLPRETLWAGMTAGVRYVAMSPNLLVILARSLLFGIGSIAVTALLPILTGEVLGGDSVTFGILLGVYGVGAIVGAMTTGLARSRLDSEGVVRAAFLVFAAGSVLLGLSDRLWLSLVALALCGVAWVHVLSLFNVSTQLATPRWVVGRALSIYQTVTFGSMAAGAWLWGAVSEALGPEVALVAAGMALVLGAAAGLVLRMPELSAQNLDPLNRFSAPVLAIDVRGRSGPIAVQVEYRIAADTTDEFLALMGQRRRIRLRDGGRQWALLRDLEDPQIWTESYHVPTWTEYIRHNQRRTQADAEVSDRLLALHRGPGGPKVRRMIERQTVPVHDDMSVLTNPKLP